MKPDFLSKQNVYAKASLRTCKVMFELSLARTDAGHFISDLCLSSSIDVQADVLLRSLGLLDADQDESKFILPVYAYSPIRKVLGNQYRPR